MSDGVPTAAVLKAVAKPETRLLAAPELTNGAAGAAVIVYLFTLNGVGAGLLFAVLQGVAIWLTRRDPFVVEVYRAKFRCKKTANRVSRPGNRYAA